MHLTLSPAYGRDYKSKKDVIADFEANKDFILHSFDAGDTYINREQINPGSTCNIRYGQMRKVCVVKVVQ